VPVFPSPRFPRYTLVGRGPGGGGISDEIEFNVYLLHPVPVLNLSDTAWMFAYLRSISICFYLSSFHHRLNITFLLFVSFHSLLYLSTNRVGFHQPLVGLKNEISVQRQHSLHLAALLNIKSIRNITLQLFLGNTVQQLLLLTKYYLGYQTEKDYINGTCSLHGGDDK
jgi:hypothetical protein